MLGRIALGSALTVVALAGGLTVASATTFNGSFNVSVYQGPGNGDINNANNQAQQSNPLIGPSHLIGTGTYTGNLDLDLGSGGTNSVGAFFASDGSSLVGCSTSCLNAVLSTPNFGTTTVFVITSNTGGPTLSGTIDHDDGVSLYDGASFSNLVAGSASPTVDIPTAFTGLTGAFELVYVEANGLPAVLDMEVTATPLPAALPLFAGGLGIVGFLSRRKKRNTGASLAAA
jgi:hypothetical protein